MKFIHTSDLHLGVRPDAGPEYTKRRPEEIWETFKAFLTGVRTSRLDLLLFGGCVPQTAAFTGTERAQRHVCGTVSYKSRIYGRKS